VALSAADGRLSVRLGWLASFATYRIALAAGA